MNGTVRYSDIGQPSDFILCLPSDDEDSDSGVHGECHFPRSSFTDTNIVKFYEKKGIIYPNSN